MDHTGMQHMGDSLGKPCITVQPAKDGSKLSTSRSSLRKVLDIQDTDKLSDPIATIPHIEDQVDKRNHKSLDSNHSSMSREQ